MERIKVLVVEDDPKLSGLLREFLGMKGFSCETASNGEEAFVRARQAMPDMVITDIKMPGMDGIALTRELRLINPDLPVMVMTGFAEYSEEDAVTAGAADFIAKPFSISEFSARFQRLVRDISKMDELRDMAHIDMLTGLLNRKIFLDRLQQAIEQAKQYRYLFAVLFLDLDRFKGVNDTCGHEAGDAVLKETARRVAAQVRKGDSVARLGGDEFGVLLSRIDTEEEAAQVARRLVEALAKPFQAGSASCDISVSIGMSIYPTHGDNVDTVLARADSAMYDVKKQGGNAYRIFSQG